MAGQVYSENRDVRRIRTNTSDEQIVAAGKEQKRVRDKGLAGAREVVNYFLVESGFFSTKNLGAIRPRKINQRAIWRGNCIVGRQHTAGSPTERGHRPNLVAPKKPREVDFFPVARKRIHNLFALITRELRGSPPEVSIRNTCATPRTGETNATACP